MDTDSSKTPAFLIFGEKSMGFFMVFPHAKGCAHLLHPDIDLSQVFWGGACAYIIY
jgi:hypothetical protein